MKTHAFRGLRLACLLCASLAGPALADVEITDGWTRETPPGARTGVGYFMLRNTGSQARKLVQVSSPAAAGVAVHQSSVDAQGVARMRPVASLELAPGQMLHFEPGGYHLMFEGLTASFKVDDEVPVTLTFSGEQPVTVKLKVRSLMDQGKPAHEHAHH